ncbi:SDR family oxidoreductase [Nocardioides marmorisolisilvae]|uniref:SDR family NAD(P)-dependent oxidoreductase n=1 Tax=Nocardioides marmorisolisilvae TaxID=1542737 RepID=A0A3N0DPA5_9ACTN|nr:SDR family NAD(P)-dependent oxidoreductase [Nocardioides marmorisolisilvae]RNL77474.1 SDR family NAD(P)-dependent oxidoreductase [Nocardioides marmorisolisilvae]
MNATASSNARTAVVTGASSGIGEATARALAADGFRVVCAARRTERVVALAAEIGGVAVTCDVTSEESVAALAAAAGDRVDVLVNNAGGAYGADKVEGADLDDWSQMFEVNVLGVVRVTKALLPALRATGGGLVVNIGSTAGQVAYAGGGGYTAAKHGLHALSQTLRLELNGEPIRVTEIAPGMVHTAEFSLVRFGDQDRADAVYADVDRPLVAGDVAEAVRWVAGLPEHVNVDELVIRPVAQAAQHQLHRGPIFG